MNTQGRRPPGTASPLCLGRHRIRRRKKLEIPSSPGRATRLQRRRTAAAGEEDRARQIPESASTERSTTARRSITGAPPPKRKVADAKTPPTAPPPPQRRRRESTHLYSMYTTGSGDPPPTRRRSGRGERDPTDPRRRECGEQTIPRNRPVFTVAKEGGESAPFASS